ncbi:MAG TPA: diaminopimelate decarboxylase, partial [Candidatus Paceibacterota bacterium]
HHVINVSKPNSHMRKVAVVGYLCESADVFNREIDVADPEEGDLVAILVAGGHGSVLSSNYNMHGMAAEVLIEDGTPRLTRRRQSYEDIMAPFV